MKLWNGYGSEHSMNLVLIGHFKTESDANKTRLAFADIEKQVREDLDADRLELGKRDERLTAELAEVVRRLKLWTFGPADAEDFAYEYSLEQDGNQLTLRTDEAEVGGFVKLMVEHEAKIEVYSAHDYPVSDAGDSE